MRAGAALAILMMMAATAVSAEAPESSIRPVVRPGASAVGIAPADPVAEPQPTPADQAEPGQTTPQTDPLARVPRPRARPAVSDVAVEEVKAAQPVAEPKKKTSKKGSVCGDPAIKGENLARISSKVKGCGVAEPVRVTSVDGVRLNPPATIDCDTAIALKSWVKKGLQPAFRSSEVVELRIAADYICRPRNNVKGNKISEHGRGKAIDIAGFILESGKSVMVVNNYNKSVRKAHKAACGIFGTTLGPGSDGYHEDHLHFDTASYRSGPYCR